MGQYCYNVVEMFQNISCLLGYYVPKNFEKHRTHSLLKFPGDSRWSKFL